MAASWKWTKKCPLEAGGSGLFREAPLYLGALRDPAMHIVWERHPLILQRLRKLVDGV